MVHVETDPLVPAPSSESWWDVPVAAVSRLPSTREARTTYEARKADQRTYL
jgi:3D-(3,5/4)-trihydroxycyclohexane-1,2-dione acylhydrolase (decyclizing)